MNAIEIYTYQLWELGSTLYHAIEHITSDMQECNDHVLKKRLLHYSNSIRENLAESYTNDQFRLPLLKNANAYIYKLQHNLELAKIRFYLPPKEFYRQTQIINEIKLLIVEVIHLYSISPENNNLN